MKKIALLSVLLVGILLLGCTSTPPAQQNTTQNTTQALAAQYGDNVSVDYTLRVDGQVVDTSLVGVAQSAGIYNANMTYKPITFQLLTGQGLITGFVKGIIGMKAGESKNFTVSPDEGYGPVNASRAFNLSRTYNISRFQGVPIDFFVQNNITLAVGEQLPSSVGNVSIYDFTNDTVTVLYTMDVGQKFTQAGLPQEVTAITNDTIFIRLDTVVNNTYVIVNSAAGTTNRAKVISLDNQTVVMDENSPLAGKTLDFEVTLRELAH